MKKISAMSFQTSALVALLLTMVQDARGVALDHARVVVNQAAATAGSGVLGAFTYNQATNTFYTTIFGSDSGLRTITNTSGQWTGGWSTGEDAYASDMLRFMHSTDVPGGKVDFSVTSGGNCTPSGILLNPVPLTVDLVLADEYGNPTVDEYGEYVTTPVTYAAGELAYIMDIASDVVAGGQARYDYTKKMYRWDLRSIGSPTSTQPDFANGQSGQAGGVTGPAWGDLGQADWNDVLSVVFTEQDFRDAITAVGGTPGTDNLGRQFTWSSDGLSIYFVEASRFQGGVYRVDAATGAIQWIYQETAASNSDTVWSEPAVVATSTCDFTGGVSSGDQIVFDGSTVSGNRGGISYIVDDGTTTSTVQTLLAGSTFRAWAENDGLEVKSIAADTAGNLYFYAYGTDSVTGQKSGGLFARDTQGRVACVFNRAMLFEVNHTQDAERSDSGGMLRLQAYSDELGTHVLYRGDNKYIGEVDIPTLGDFNGDDLVDAADRGFMIDQYKKSCYDTVPTIAADGQEAYIDYLIADMNGSAHANEKGSGYLENVAVTFADVLTLAQFVDGGLLAGDLNWDGVARSTADWSIFDANFKATPNSGVWSWFDGDLDHDGDVDVADRLLMGLVPGDANRDGIVDGSDATILAGYWQHGSGMTTPDATWTMGDFNDDGIVDGSDATILAGYWQQQAPPVTQAVPEPSVFVMILLGLAIGILKRRKTS